MWPPNSILLAALLLIPHAAVVPFALRFAGPPCITDARRSPAQNDALLVPEQQL